jgi:hypothetical protein
MPKSKPQTSPKTKELPITFNLKLDGQDQTFNTDNVLKSLRALVVDPLKIKTRPIIEVTYEGKTFRKVFHVIQFKRLLVNETLKQITAKQLNMATGIKVDNYL